MRVLVLGAAAGGGFPQWNANNAQCRRARAGDPAAVPQTQSSLAIGDGEGRWFLLNASPDLRQQIEANPPLHPRRGLRDSPIAGVVLTNADVDHVAGLLSLRERQPFRLHATARVLATLAANSIFNVLNPEVVIRSAFQLGEAFPLLPPEGGPARLEAEAFAVPGKVALYLEDLAAENFGSTAEDTIGLNVRDLERGTRLVYIPGCARATAELKARITGADLLFFDGTLYRDDEMIQSGEGVKTGRRMGHISISGPEGAIAALDGVEVGRRFFIHLNNTNPVLLRDSPERRAVEQAGWEVAMDGLEIAL